MKLENDLEIVLARWQTRLRELGSSGVAGYTAEQISDTEKHLVKPLPPEIRRLYEIFTPESWKIATRNSGEPELSPIEKVRWYPTQIFHSKDADVEEFMENAPPGPLEPGWLFLGGLGCNVALIWCEHYPPAFSRAIIGYYMMDADPALVFGESLAQWLDRLLKYNGYEYAFRTEALLESSHTPFEQELFLADHLRLNPQEHQQVEFWKKFRAKKQREAR